MFVNHRSSESVSLERLQEAFSGLTDLSNNNSSVKQVSSISHLKQLENSLKIYGEVLDAKEMEEIKSQLSLNSAGLSVNDLIKRLDNC